MYTYAVLFFFLFFFYSILSVSHSFDNRYLCLPLFSSVLIQTRFIKCLRCRNLFDWNIERARGWIKMVCGNSIRNLYQGDKKKLRVFFSFSCHCAAEKNICRAGVWRIDQYSAWWNINIEENKFLILLEKKILFWLQAIFIEIDVLDFCPVSYAKKEKEKKSKTKYIIFTYHSFCVRAYLLLIYLLWKKECKITR